MTDGGALPAWFSRTVAGLRDAGWLATCVTVGQAFGGDLEAVSVHSGLLAARLVAGADVAVVVQGPGNLGTGTRWGFSGVSSGEAVNAAGVLSGRPVAALRVSQADQRERHLGVSHHSLTALGRVALTPADVVVPALPGALGDRVRSQAAVLGPPSGRHRLVEVDVSGLRAALETSPVPLSTMGRGLGDDEAAFLAAAAAGRHAATLLDDRAATCQRAALLRRVGHAFRPLVAASLAFRPLAEPIQAPEAAGTRVTGSPDVPGRGRRRQRASTRSTTKMRVSPGAIAPPAPRSPYASWAGWSAAAGHPPASPRCPGPSRR